MSSTDIILSFDFGVKKIGVAVGQKLTCTARPLTVVRSKSGTPNWKNIEKIFYEWNPVILIVGLPLKIDGSEQSITILAKKFAKQLNNKFHVTVEMHDERFSTSEARLNYVKNYNDWKPFEKKNCIDAISAQIILTSWLNKY